MWCPTLHFVLFDLQAAASDLATAVESLSQSSCSLLQTILCGLPLARSRTPLCISCVLGQRVVFEPRRTPVVTQFTSTETASNFVLVAIWQRFEAELAISKNVLLNYFCSRRFDSARHAQRCCCVASWSSKLVNKFLHMSKTTMCTLHKLANSVARSTQPPSRHGSIRLRSAANVSTKHIPTAATFSEGGTLKTAILVINPLRSIDGLAPPNHMTNLRWQRDRASVSLSSDFMSSSSLQTMYQFLNRVDRPSKLDLRYNMYGTLFR